MFWRLDHDPNNDFTEAASGNPHTAFVLGILVAVALFGYGLVCVATQHSYIPGNRGSQGMDVYGASAVAMGLVWSSLGCLLHCHYFWSYRERFHGYAQLGKLCCGVVFVIALFYVIIRVWFLG